MIPNVPESTEKCQDILEENELLLPVKAFDTEITHSTLAEQETFAR